MGLDFMHRRRRLGATLALLGMAFYAVFIPWHTVSQASLALDPAQAWADADTMCHNVSADSQQPGSSKPGAPKTHCPICSGFAALQFALAGAWVAVVLPTDTGAGQNRRHARASHCHCCPRPAKPRSPSPRLISTAPVRPTRNPGRRSSAMASADAELAHGAVADATE